MKFSGGGKRTGWYDIGAPHVQLDLMKAFSTVLALTMHLVANIFSVGSQITDALFGECYCNSWLRRDWPDIRLILKSKSLYSQSDKVVQVNQAQFSAFLMYIKMAKTVELIKLTNKIAVVRAIFCEYE